MKRGLAQMRDYCPFQERSRKFPPGAFLSIISPNLGQQTDAHGGVHLAYLAVNAQADVIVAMMPEGPQKGQFS